MLFIRIERRNVNTDETETELSHMEVGLSQTYPTFERFRAEVNTDLGQENGVFIVFVLDEGVGLFEEQGDQHREFFDTLCQQDNGLFGSVDFDESITDQSHEHRIIFCEWLEELNSFIDAHASYHIVCHRANKKTIPCLRLVLNLTKLGAIAVLVK